MFLDAPYFDPAFIAHKDDIILCSADMIHYGMSSDTLRTTSGFFSTMLSYNGTHKEGHHIAMDEPGKVLGTLLRMISGLQIPRWESYDYLELILRAAEKYGMLGPISVIRHTITFPLMPPDPIRMYAIAARHDWEEEVKQASTRSLTLSIHDPQYVDQLKQIPPTYLIRLFNLHYRRVKEFRLLLDSPGLAGNNDNRRCDYCDHTIDNHPWRDLKEALVRELEKKPMGSTVREHMNKWKVAQTCWSTTCSNPPCHFQVYGRTETLVAINACLDSLPTTV